MRNEILMYLSGMVEISRLIGKSRLVSVIGIRYSVIFIGREWLLLKYFMTYCIVPLKSTKTGEILSNVAVRPLSSGRGCKATPFGEKKKYCLLKNIIIYWICRNKNRPTVGTTGCEARGDGV